MHVLLPVLAVIGLPGGTAGLAPLPASRAGNHWPCFLRSPASRAVETLSWPAPAVGAQRPHADRAVWRSHARTDPRRSTGVDTGARSPAVAPSYAEPRPSQRRS